MKLDVLKLSGFPDVLQKVRCYMLERHVGRKGKMEVLDLFFQRVCTDSLQFVDKTANLSRENNGFSRWNNTFFCTVKKVLYNLVLITEMLSAPFSIIKGTGLKDPIQYKRPNPHRKEYQPMPDSHSILLTLNLKEPNIHFEENYLTVESVKGIRSLVYTGTLSAETPDICCYLQAKFHQILQPKFTNSCNEVNTSFFFPVR